MSDHEEVRPLKAGASESFPVIGETIEGLSEHLVRNGTLKSPEQFARIRRDAVSILRSSRPFNGPDGQRTGLVVGYVQSGKTLSMAAVSALAHDNGCRIIIVLAGVTTLLLDQSVKRFQTDLRAASGRRNPWNIFNSNGGFPNGARNLERAVAEWRDPALANVDPRTLFYVVLKNHAHLTDLQEVLSAVDLRGIPALIIDDEADQAGLNTTPDAPEASRTYRQIKAVRDALPHHTYLQYTATPQAPLLIALDDMLSPAFAELVEPGDGYTGGATFFGRAADDNLVRAVPDEDTFKPGSPPDEPPTSLLNALRVFLVGCAVAAVRGSGPSPRSMLVHPSQRKSDHSKYVNWVNAAINNWAETLRGSDPDDKADTLADLRVAYDELAKTDQALPPFDDLVHRIQVTLNRISVKEVNSQDGSEVDWVNFDEHILVGGEKLNRGFTVEGLTVTYMPRDAGGWNADTLQQRARFFGYKKGYLSLCRLYLHPAVITAFRSYVTHEEDIRKQLAEHAGKPLREWRRAFFLSSQMRPTRRNVLSDTYYKIPRDRVWFQQRQPHVEGAGGRNLDAVRQYEAGLAFHRDEDFFEHELADVSLRDVYEKLLVTYETRGNDMAGWYGLLVVIADILDADPTATATWVRMHGDGGRERVRSTSEGVVTLHQGRGSGKKDGGYPGDAKMILERGVTIQSHVLRVDEAPVLIAALAIHVPQELRRDDTGAMGQR